MQHETIDTAGAARSAAPARRSPKGRHEAAMIDLARDIGGDPWLAPAVRATRLFLAVFAIFVVIAAPFAGH